MAVVVVNEVEGGNQDFYEQVNSKVMPGGQLPDGCEVHIAGPSDKGWRVITVWESEDRFQQALKSVARQKLKPAAPPKSRRSNPS